MKERGGGVQNSCPGGLQNTHPPFSPLRMPYGQRGGVEGGGNIISPFSGLHIMPENVRELFGDPNPRDPDILNTVRVVNVLSVLNLLCVVIHY